MQLFNLQAPYKPTGDQPQAIKKLVGNIKQNKQFQTLLGVTGSGKTFTVANVIAQVNKPVLVISHNKTLTAQLYQEFREFFPNNAVHYFVSYYDYYQPEAYIPQKDLYIEKDASINEEIDKLRLAATTALLARKDVIVVASVSSIYNIGSPTAFRSQVKIVNVNDEYNVISFSRLLVNLLYERNDFDLKRGTFRVRNNNIDVYLAYADLVLRIVFFNNKIKEILLLDPVSFVSLNSSKYKNFIETIIKFNKDRILSIGLYPAKHYVIPPEKFDDAINKILKDMQKRVDFFKKQGKEIEANRIKQKVLYDIEMLQEVGYCKGIENYSVYFDGRNPGDPPYSLLDYYPDDYLLIIDESHMTIPQIRGMYNGDYARKKNLVDYGFRLPTAFDNRPLKFDEFEARMGYTIFMSATPSDYEIKKSLASAGKNGIVEQLIRPTGIVDPEIIIRPAKDQVKDLISEIEKVIKQKNRVLVITLTKRMSEELTNFLQERGFKVKYLHSDIKTLERSDILTALRKGDFDVLIGINLLREGIDLPEVKLVAILDADKQGFLRSTTSLIQIMGRAARHVNGYVILYADELTDSIKQAVDEVTRRRKKQLEYNKMHNIKPKSIKKSIRPRLLISDDKSKDTLNKEILGKVRFATDNNLLKSSIETELAPMIKAFKVANKTEQRKIIKNLRKVMNNFALNLEFEKAIIVRDIIKSLTQS